MVWPPDVREATRPLLKTMLDSVGNRLARAELTLKKFTVITLAAARQTTPRTMADVRNSLGANLLLGASLGVERSGYRLSLRLFDAVGGSVLRAREKLFSSADIARLASEASIIAAQLLDIPDDPGALKDQDELGRLTPATFQLFSVAGDLQSQPNDSGLDGAIEKLQKLIEGEPRFALGYANLSLAYSRKFRIGKDVAFLTLAGKNATMALQYNPQSARGQMALAKFDLLSGNTKGALDGFAEALRVDPGNPEVLIYKAVAFSDLSRMKDAEDVYREIIRQRPNYWPAYNDLGDNLFRQTRYSEAAVAFGEAAAVAPRVALPLANQGTMYAILGQKQKAEEAFLLSLKRAPNEFAYANLGSLAFLARGDYQTSVDDYGKALEQNPKSHRTWRNIADSYAMLGDSRRQMESYGKAAALLAESLQVNPTPGPGWVTLAFYEAKLGRRAEAESDLKEADKRGLDPRSRFIKAQALAVLGRKEEALELLLSCIDGGLAVADVELALDLASVRADPRYLRRMAGEKTAASQKSQK